MEHESMVYESQRSGENVWPNDICPAYTPREGSIAGIKGCWYCRYADFHLNQEKALDVGVCKWPKKITK